MDDKPPVPASDRRRMQFWRLQVADRDSSRQTLANDFTTSDESPTDSTYPFTRGIVLVNDGVAYGERVVETLRTLVRDGETGTYRLQRTELTSRRTRTGKHTLERLTATSSPPAPGKDHDAK